MKKSRTASLKVEKQTASSDQHKSLTNNSTTPALFKVLHDATADHIKHPEDSLISADTDNSVASSNENGLKQSMVNAVKSISNSASMIVSSMNTKTSKDAKSIINSQSTSDSISASIKNFLVKKSTSISIANSNYSRFNTLSSMNFSHSLATSSVINSTKASASNAINSYQSNDQRRLSQVKQLKNSYNQLSSNFTSTAKLIQSSASTSASSYVKEMVSSNLTQIMNLSSSIKQINENTYQAISRANIDALNVIKNLKGDISKDKNSSDSDNHSSSNNSSK